MNFLNKFKQYIPSIYNTRYSRELTLRGVEIELLNLRCNIINGGQISEIFVSESPHFRCAQECIANSKVFREILYSDNDLINSILSQNNLIYTKDYINYVKSAHPETDAIESLKDFLRLVDAVSTCGVKRKFIFSVLAKRRIGYRAKSNSWILIDGLHRSSIFLALNEPSIIARVKFP